MIYLAEASHIYVRFTGGRFRHVRKHVLEHLLVNFQKPTVELFRAAIHYVHWRALAQLAEAMDGRQNVAPPDASRPDYRAPRAALGKAIRAVVVLVAAVPPHPTAKNRC